MGSQPSTFNSENTDTFEITENNNGISYGLKVSNLPNQITKECLKLFFENEKRSGGGPVRTVDLDVNTHTAVIIFKDSKAPVECCERIPTIKGCKIQVEIYNEYVFIRPDPVYINLDERKLQFVTHSYFCRNVLIEQLKVCHGSIQTWPSGQYCTLRVACTLHNDIKDCQKLAETWESDVIQCVHTVFDSYSVESVQISQDEWKKVIDNIRQLIISEPDLVALCVDKNTCELSFVGYPQHVSELFKEVKQIIADVRSELNIKQSQVWVRKCP